MTGYLQVMAPCVGCGEVFTFHPRKVPSVTIPREQGGSGSPSASCSVRRPGAVELTSRNRAQARYGGDRLPPLMRQATQRRRP